VDSVGVLEAMARDEGLAPTAERLLRVPVDQTQYGPDDSGLNKIGLDCIAPIVQDIQVKDGGSGEMVTRRMVKMATGSTAVASGAQKAHAVATTPELEPTVDTSGWDTSHNPADDHEMICTFKDVVFAASAHAPRFKVMAGEALIVDNYRASTQAASTLRPSGIWRLWRVRQPCGSIRGPSSLDSFVCASLGARAREAWNGSDRASNI